MSAKQLADLPMSWHRVKTVVGLLPNVKRSDAILKWCEGSTARVRRRSGNALGAVEASSARKTTSTGDEAAVIYDLLESSRPL